MKTRKRHLTARIKPSTKHALMAQLALAADEIERLRRNAIAVRELIDAEVAVLNRRWWHRFAWWRA